MLLALAAFVLTYLLDNFDLAISTLLVCTNIAHIAIASLVTVAVTRQWGLTAVSVSTIITTLVVFFAGEMLPKSVGKKYSVTLLKLCADCHRSGRRRSHRGGRGCVCHRGGALRHY